MTFTTAGYVLFFIVSTTLYFWVPKRAQNSVLAIASIVFYVCNLPTSSTITTLQRFLPLCTLLASTAVSFCLAQSIARAKDDKRKRLTALAVGISIAVLALFKYYNFFVPTVLGITNFAKLALPLGISFYTFATISYLVDVSRGDMQAETNLVDYFVFVAFFGTITSGPICRARKLLPQLKQARTFDAQRTCDALRLALFGFFKWIAVANVLGLVVNTVFENLAQYQGFTLMAICGLYALQLYFEFSGYSDIARASAMILGIEIPINFKTPYFATNFSGFWNQWHISLSSWLQDYVFMPLVWGRWTSHVPVLGKHCTKPPVISSVALVFLLSGFWHGNTWPFVVWGALQAIYRVSEELLHQWYKKPVKKPALWLRIFKTSCVFILWAQSLIFFRVGLLKDGTVHDGIAYFMRQFENLSHQSFLSQMTMAIEDGFYAKSVMVVAYLVFILFVIAFCVYTDWLQCFRYKGKHCAIALGAMRPLAKWCIYYVMIGCILVGFILQSGGFGTVNFAYANF